MDRERALRILERAGLRPQPIGPEHWLYRRLPPDQPCWTIRDGGAAVEVIPEQGLIALAQSVLRVCASPARLAEFTSEVLAHEPAIRQRLN